MKNALILGADSDIAQALTRLFAADGYDLTLTAMNTDLLKDTVKDLKIRFKIKVKTLEFDALKTDTHHTFYDKLNPKPDVAASIFGYLGDTDGSKTDFTEARKIIDINFTGAVSILNIVATDFEKRKSGVIIAISSVAGDRGRQSNYIYGSAKGALSIYLAGLRNRLAKSGVHVLTVKPGFVNTKMTADLDLPASVTAEPEQAAADIYKAFKKRKNTVYTLWMWRYIMLVIRHIPEFIFKKMSM